MRRLRLPKIGPVKAKGLFEEYFYILLGVTFLGVAILGKAGGLSLYNALIIGGWLTAFLWFANQWKGYLAEKSRAANGNNATPEIEPRVEVPKEPLPLPPGMKPMIGPQWPIKPGARPVWPGRPNEQPVSAPKAQPPRAPGGTTRATPGKPKKHGFVYERPTLPDRKPKLPRNWVKPDDKKPKR